MNDEQRRHLAAKAIVDRTPFGVMVEKSADSIGDLWRVTLPEWRGEWIIGEGSREQAFELLTNFIRELQEARVALMDGKELK